MRLQKLKISNYKGFRETEWLVFGTGFNIIVGQNNAGKTALLETLRLKGCEKKPYRGKSTPRLAPLSPNFLFQIEVSISGPELAFMLMRRGNINIPVERGDSERLKAQLDSLLSASDIRFGLRVSKDQAFGSEQYPSHGRFAEMVPHFSINVRPTNDPAKVEIAGSGQNSGDDLASVIEGSISQYIYVFKPERLNLGRSGVEDTDILAPDASNLPAVLLKLQGNKSRFARFNEHVCTIFPSITGVAVVPSDTHAQQIEIRIWTIDAESERDDLAIKLSECGTGVGQVLSILYVAMTRQANIIAIDEPNSFLHPGAAKKLIQILRQYWGNQYILATHSADLIAVADPNTVHLVRWSGEQSEVEQLDRSSIVGMNRILADVGASLSDVFGADRVIWVEGATEQVCFPKILGGRVPLGLLFAPLRNTGDLEAKRVKAEASWEIYERLTSGAVLFPPVLAFSFDQEDRNSQQMRDIIRRSKGRARFLPRSTYENFLIHSGAIAGVLNEELVRYKSSKTVTTERVEEWLTANCDRYSRSLKVLGDYKNPDWQRECNATKLLDDLFVELSDTELAYHKLTHSVAITEWLLENDATALTELSEYVGSLVSNSEK